MLDEANGGRTDVPETAALYARAAAHEAEPGILAVSINAGFAEADIAEVGPTVLVTYDAALPEAARARAIAEELADSIWDERGSVVEQLPDARGRRRRLRATFDAANGPLVIADYADNPGAGAYGDATACWRPCWTAGLHQWRLCPDDRPRGGGVPASPRRWATW